MNEDQSDAAPCYSIAAVERDTGLSKDTLRVWERRYGFPQPARDAAGDRSYPAEQVERLRTICRLMDAGHRPGRIVALAPDALQALLPVAPPPALAGAARVAGDGTALEPYLALVGQHDVQGLRGQLGQALLRMGLEAFVVGLVAPLTTAVGEAWMQGRFQVFEEHLYTECLTGVLRQAIAEVLLALEGCQCLSLGPQTPVAEIARAAHAAQVDIVALSFSASMPGPVAQAGLRELRGLLPTGVALWVGGKAPFLQTRALPGVLALPALGAVHAQVALWRHQTMATSRAT